MSEAEIRRLVEEFAEAAVKHLEYTVAGAGSRKINREAEKVETAYRQLKGYGDEGKRALLPLMDSSDLAVASMAATYLMHYAPDLSKRTMLRAAKDPGILGLEAKYALKRFDDGTWQREFE